MHNTTSPTTTPATKNITATVANAAGSIAGLQALTDINGLRVSGIFPQGKEPSIRTLRSWTYERRIPHHRLGHFVYYDIPEVAAHIRTKLLVPPRN